MSSCPAERAIRVAPQTPTRVRAAVSFFEQRVVRAGVRFGVAGHRPLRRWRRSWTSRPARCRAAWTARFARTPRSRLSVAQAHARLGAARSYLHQTLGEVWDRFCATGGLTRRTAGRGATGLDACDARGGRRGRRGVHAGWVECHLREPPVRAALPRHARRDASSSKRAAPTTSTWARTCWGWSRSARFSEVAGNSSADGCGDVLISLSQIDMSTAIVDPFPSPAAASHLRARPSPVPHRPRPALSHARRSRSPRRHRTPKASCCACSTVSPASASRMPPPSWASPPTPSAPWSSSSPAAGSLERTRRSARRARRVPAPDAARPRVGHPARQRARESRRSRADQRSIETDRDQLEAAMPAMQRLAKAMSRSEGLLQ